MASLYRFSGHRRESFLELSLADPSTTYTAEWVRGGLLAVVLEGDTIQGAAVVDQPATTNIRISRAFLGSEPSDAA